MIENPVGYVVKVESGNITTVLIDEIQNLSESNQKAARDELIGKLGSYLLIKQHDVSVVCQVFSSFIENLGSNTAVEKTVLSLLPLGELNSQNQFIRGVKKFPTVGARTYEVEGSIIRHIFSHFAHYRYKVGYLSNHDGLAVCLDPNALFGRHLAILGQSGSGKSWAVASLLQKAVEKMPNAHIIMLDLHGEYCWVDEFGERQSAFSERVMHYLDARRLEIPYWIMTFSELVELFILENDPNSSAQIAFMRECVLELRSKEAVSLGLGQVSVDAPVYFSLLELHKRIKSANEERSDFGKVKGTLFGCFDQFLLRLESRLNDVRYDFLFKPHHHKTSNSLGDLLRNFIGLGNPKRAISIIDLSSVPSDVRPIISAKIGRLAFEFNFWNPRRNAFPILLVCEEAHAYIPRENDSRFKATRYAMERIAKEGRKYGVGLAVVSQRPHELSETVLSQCGTFICLRITNPDDQDYVRKLVPDGEADLVSTLASLGRGEAMVMGEATPIPLRFQIYKPDPAPNSNDVNYHQAWGNGSSDLDVEAIVTRWRKQSQI